MLYTVLASLYTLAIASYLVLCSWPTACVGVCLLPLPQFPLHAGSDAILPVDPSLTPTAISILPSLTGNQDSSINDFQLEVIKQLSSVVLTEGLPQLHQSS